MKRPHFALPEIYDDSLSYYDVLRKLIKSMHVIADNLNKIPEQIANEAKAREQADVTLRTNIDNEKQSREQADQEIREGVSNKISELKSDLTSDGAIKSRQIDAEFTNYFDPYSTVGYDTDTSYENISVPRQSANFRVWVSFLPEQLRVYNVSGSEIARYTASHFTQSGSLYYVDITNVSPDDSHSINSFRLFLSNTDIPTAVFMINTQPPSIYVPFGSYVILNNQIIATYTNAIKKISPVSANHIAKTRSNGDLVDSGAEIVCDSDYNTGIGIGIFEDLNGATHNTAFGYRALKSVEHNSEDDVSGKYNTAVGYGALENNTFGNHNTAIGLGAMQSNTTGENNTAVGEDALMSSNGSYNAVFGQRAFQNATNGDYNTIIGQGAGYNANGHPTGSNNVLVGFGTHPKDGNGSNNVCIGSASGAAPGVSNATVVGYSQIASKNNQMILGAGATEETIICGNDIIFMNTNGVKRKLVFNDGGAVTWKTVT